MFQRPTPPEIETTLIIIGAGVSGLRLAEILANSEIDFWLLGSPYESQLAKAGILEDTPLPEGTIGLNFIEQRFDEVKSKNIQHRSSLCTGIERRGEGFLVKTKFQDFISKHIVLATGNKQKSLGFDGEDIFFHKGISNCTVCDFPLYREKPVAVIGNHPYTIRAAKLMKKYTDPVALLWYQKDDPPLLEGITVYSEVDKVRAEGDELLQKVSFRHKEGETSLNVRGLFVEGQPVPNTDFIGNLDIILDQGYVKINNKYETNLTGIWAVGDITGQTTNYEEAKQAAIELGQILIDKFGN